MSAAHPLFARSVIRSLLCLLLAMAPLGAFALPAERPISEPRTGLASTSVWLSLRTATGGGRFLVAWYSRDRGGQAQLLDEAGRRIGATSRGLPLAPHVVYWRDDVQAWYLIGSNNRYTGYVRMDRDGVLLDREPIELERPDPPHIFEKAVWTGSALIVTMQRVQGDDAFAVAVYDAGLQLKAVHTLGRQPRLSRIATDGATALVAFREADQPDTAPIQLVLFDRDGGLVLRKDLHGSAGLAGIGSRGDGSGYYVLHQPVPTALALFHGFHLDHQLAKRNVPGSIGRAERLYAATGAPEWDGSSYVFFYSVVHEDRSREIRMARISAEGTPVVDERALVPDPGMTPSTGLIAAAGMGTAVLVYQRTDDPLGESEQFYTLRAGHAPADFASAEEVALEWGAAQQLRPAAVSGRTQSLVVWREQLFPKRPLYVLAARVDADGNVLDPLSLVLGTSSRALTAPGLATDGEGFLAAWYDDEGLLTAHVAADGTVGPRTRLQRYKDTEFPWSAPVVVSNGTGYLVVWQRMGGNRNTMLGARVRGDGTAIDTVPIELGSGTAVVHGASDGRDYLLAWGARVVRVSASGARVERVSVQGSGTLALWWNGASYSLVQVEPPPYPFRYQLLRVTPDGTATKIGATEPWPDTLFAWSNSAPQCRGTACSWLFGINEDGRSLLREMRTADDGTLPFFRLGNAIPMEYAFVRDESPETLRIVPFGVAGGRRFIALTRYALDPPYAGVSRIFIRAVDSARTRTVRH